MVFYSRRDNWKDSEHADPLGNIFFMGGIPGALAALHYGFFLLPGYSHMHRLQLIVCAFWFTGMLSAGFYRAIQFVRTQKQSVSHKNVSSARRVCFLFSFAAIITFFAFLGVIPVAFIDYVGGEIIGLAGNRHDFFIMLGRAGILGLCFSLPAGALMIFMSQERMLPFTLRERVFFFCSILFSVTLFAGLCPRGYFWYIFAYGSVYGIFLCIMLMFRTRRSCT